MLVVNDILNLIKILILSVIICITDINNDMDSYLSAGELETLDSNQHYKNEEKVKGNIKFNIMIVLKRKGLLHMFMIWLNIFSHIFIFFIYSATSKKKKIARIL